MLSDRFRKSTISSEPVIALIGNSRSSLQKKSTWIYHQLNLQLRDPNTKPKRSTRKLCRRRTSRRITNHSHQKTSSITIKRESSGRYHRKNPFKVHSRISSMLIKRETRRKRKKGLRSNKNRQNQKATSLKIYLMPIRKNLWKAIKPPLMRKTY